MLSVLGFMIGGFMGLTMGVHRPHPGTFISISASSGVLMFYSSSVFATFLEGLSFTSMEFMLSGFSGSLFFLVMVVFSMCSLSIFTGKSEGKVVLNLLIFLHLLTFLSSGVFLLSDYVCMFICFEGALLPVFFLVLGLGRQPERMAAVMSMFMYTLLGSMPFFVLLLLFFNLSGSSFFLFLDSINQESSLGWVVMVLPFLVKLPLFGLHGWLPKAHVEAPLMGSMMLAGVLLKMGVYGLFIFNKCTSLSWNLSYFILPVLVLGGVMSAMVCLYQSDLKALIAYSSVSHMCFCATGIMSFSSLGWFGALLMSFSHGVCSPWLFYLCEVLKEIYGTRSLAIMSGGIVVQPFLMFLMLLGLSGNSGMPPTLSYFSEICILFSNFSNCFWSGVFLCSICFLGVLYSFKLFLTLSHLSPLLFEGKVESNVKSVILVISFISGFFLLGGSFFLDFFF